jgi:hypothetical protein
MSLKNIIQMLILTINLFLFQRISDEISGSHYILEAEVCNEGVKFSDTFSLSIRYCLVQTSVKTTNLRVTAQVNFSKPINSFLKRSYLFLKFSIFKKNVLFFFFRNY